MGHAPDIRITLARGTSLKIKPEIRDLSQDGLKVGKDHIDARYAGATVTLVTEAPVGRGWWFCDLKSIPGPPKNWQGVALYHASEFVLPEGQTIDPPESWKSVAPKAKHKSTVRKTKIKFEYERPVIFTMARNDMSKDHLEAFIGIPDADHEGYGHILDRGQARILRDYLNTFLKNDTVDTTVDDLLAQLAEQHTELMKWRREDELYGDARRLINECAAHLKSTKAESTDEDQ